MANGVPIPLCRRDGSIRAVVIIDATDWPAVRKHTWYLAGKYAQASIGGCKVRLHRFILGDPPTPGLEVDHRDRDPLNNQRSNLRWLTRLDNRANNAPHRERFGYRGVSWSKGAWQAQVMRAGRRQYLGRFIREEDAAEAVRRFWAAIEKETP